MEMVFRNVNLFRIVTFNCPAVKVRNELGRIVLRGPFGQVINLDLNDLVQFQMSGYRSDFRRWDRRGRRSFDFGNSGRWCGRGSLRQDCALSGRKREDRRKNCDRNFGWVSHDLVPVETELTPSWPRRRALSCERFPYRARRMRAWYGS